MVIDSISNIFEERFRGCCTVVYKTLLLKPKQAIIQRFMHGYRERHSKRGFKYDVLILYLEKHTFLHIFALDLRITLQL